MQHWKLQKKKVLGHIYETWAEQIHAWTVSGVKFTCFDIYENVRRSEIFVAADKFYSFLHVFMWQSDQQWCCKTEDFLDFIKAQ